MFNNTVTHSQVSETELAVHLRQVFNYMTGGVALSGLVAWLTATNPALAQIAQASSWVFAIIWLGFGFFMHKIIFSMQPAAALGVFVAFSALTGFSLSSLMLQYTGASIVTAFLVAAGMFATAAIYGYTTKKSMAGMMGIISMLSIGLLIAMVANMFIQSSGLSFWISLAVVPLVAIGTAVEMNMVKENYEAVAHDEVMKSRMAVLNAASFYMNFIVMFIHILQLMGVARGEE